MAADALDVAQVTWAGKVVDAVRNEYVFRMPQTNVATAASVLDYGYRTPTLPKGWSSQSLGMGFFKLTAPGATPNALVTWARGNGVQSLNVNSVRRATATPNDPLYSDGANWAFPQISADEAWDEGKGSGSMIVAVLDSGIDYNHVDLLDNVWQNPGEVADGRDNDGNGYIDDLYGINALTGSGDPMDDLGHGTFAAGLIGAVGNNLEGIAGTNWDVSLMAVKVMDAAGNVPLAAEIRGLQYVLGQKVAGRNIVAANLGFGSSLNVSQEFDLLNQIAELGVVLVAAAGNNMSDNDVRLVYPAGYSVKGLISVAASSQSDRLAGFSNYGDVSVDLAAPGVDLLSTRAAFASSAYRPHPTVPGYTYGSGTSFATPLVAGTAALLKSLNQNATVDQIKAAILDGADRVASMSGVVLTGGRLNMAKAVEKIIAAESVLPTATFKEGQNLSFLEGSRGYSFADIKVSLDRPVDPGTSAVVWYETRAGGTAISGLDFVSQSGFVSFTGNEMEKTIRLKIVGDTRPEPDEQFPIRFVESKSRGVTVDVSSETSVTIIDDDDTSTPTQPGGTVGGVPLVSVDVKREAVPGSPGQTRVVPVYEGQSATFVVSLDKTSDKTVSVRYRTNQPTLVPLGTAVAGLDYTAVDGTLTFRPGERTKEFTVKTMTDGQLEGDEIFRVVLQEPVNADLGSGGGGGGGGGGGTGGGGTGAAAVDATILNVIPVPLPAPRFQISLVFPDTSFTTSQQAIFRRAAARWEEIIVGDLPNVTDPVTGQLIDDIVIVAKSGTSDGVGGVIGSAGPDEFRDGVTGLPWKGTMELDLVDVARRERTGQLFDDIVHEMAHVLGFGAVWQPFGLLQYVNATNSTDPIFVGANALREYRSIFGLPKAFGVPVEATGGAGVAGGHWRESVMRTELMTPLTEAAGTAMPISRITVGSMQDIGYTVNYAKAGSYAKPSARTVSTIPGPTPPSPASPSRWFAVAGEAAVAADGRAGQGRPMAAAFALIAEGIIVRRPGRVRAALPAKGDAPLFVETGVR